MIGRNSATTSMLGLPGFVDNDDSAGVSTGVETSSVESGRPFGDCASLGVGAPAFSAPEVFAGQVPGYAADMWAFGVTLFAMVYGRLPFRGASYLTVQHNVLNDALVFPPAAPQTKPWAELIAQLLVKDPQRRLTASQLSMSPLFADGNVATAVMPFQLAPSPSLMQLVPPLTAPLKMPMPPTPSMPFAARLFSVTAAEATTSMKVATVTLGGPLGRTRVAADLADFAAAHPR
jgi:serine/threonine protein kinase